RDRRQEKAEAEIIAETGNFYHAIARLQREIAAAESKVGDAGEIKPLGKVRTYRARGEEIPRKDQRHNGQGKGDPWLPSGFPREKPQSGILQRGQAKVEREAGVIAMVLIVKEDPVERRDIDRSKGVLPQ